MAKPGFLELKVYRQAERLADLISKIVVKWDPFHRNTVGERLVRAADGVGANIALGFGLRAIQDNRRHVRMARVSMKRTTGCGARSAESSFNRNTSALKPLLDDLAPMLKAYLRNIGAQPRRPRCPRSKCPRCPAIAHVTVFRIS